MSGTSRAHTPDTGHRTPASGSVRTTHLVRTTQYSRRVPDLIATFGWPLLAAMTAGAVIIGFSKTSFGGVAAIAVAVFAWGMPAKESTATVLLLLLVGDVVAVSRYRTVSWALLLRLLPSVLPGLALGALFMSVVDDVVMRRTIGGLLVVMVLLQLWQRRRRDSPHETAATPALASADEASPQRLSPSPPGGAGPC